MGSRRNKPRAASRLRGAAGGGAARKGGVGGAGCGMREGGLEGREPRGKEVERWREGGLEGLARNLRRETGSAQPISGHRGPSIMLRVRGQPTSPLLVTSRTITFVQPVWWFRLDPQEKGELRVCCITHGTGAAVRPGREGGRRCYNKTSRPDPLLGEKEDGREGEKEWGGNGVTWRMKRGRKEGRATWTGGSKSKIWKDMVGVGSLGRIIAYWMKFFFQLFRPHHAGRPSTVVPTPKAPLRGSHLAKA
ncbi:hypothetical protein E2C01_013384 [Portunus trituberculatus]|uniref:Uncharacterized protein n=1 Tax=Portunus trituberculatus TaxID=210409 RepID=A0A5B7DG27_PORTR|nr:hypothetical protein [Portunus trituberculatus]